MAEAQEVKEFPDVTQKLAAPKKLSAFEKERQAAEAKRQRAEAENAAALKEFEDSFAGKNDGDPQSRNAGGRVPPTGPRDPGSGSEIGPGMGSGYGTPDMWYGMPPSGPRSGLGGVGPMPIPPPPSLKRKRALDEMREAQEAMKEQEMLIGTNFNEDPDNGTQSEVQEEEREDNAPKATIQLSSLPPGTTIDEVKTLLKDHLKVFSLQFFPMTGPGPAAKRSLSALAILSSEMTTTQIDNAVSALKNKYLGCGFYLSISRHLPSTSLHPSVVASMGAASSEPFGAEKPKDLGGRPSMRNAPPPIERRGFAPPEFYDSPAARSMYGGMSTQDIASVTVRPPLDIQSIRAIHVVVDRLLTEPDPERAMEIEAILMAQPNVRNDERFAFLFDSRSSAGIYYRYLLWSSEDFSEVVREHKRQAQGSERIYEDMIIDWTPPHAQVPFSDLTNLAQVVTDIEYVSSDEESDDEGGERRFNAGREGEVALEQDEKRHLSPLQQARLTQLLSRLPTSNAMLRKGDVARVTNFVINHAGQGAEEIVDMLLLNISKPFSYSLASKYEEINMNPEEEDEYEPDDNLPTMDTDASQLVKDGKRDEDPSNAKLIALYLISDILSASSTAGARNAWKYRQLFENGFKAQKIFEHLGRLDKELQWGRLKAEQWKRKIGSVFSIWESWSVFSKDAHEQLTKNFLEPPLSEEEKAAERAERGREAKGKPDEKWMGKFKRVGQNGSASPKSGQALPATNGSGHAQGEDDDAATNPHASAIGSAIGEMVAQPVQSRSTGQDGAADERPEKSATQAARRGSPGSKEEGFLTSTVNSSIGDSGRTTAPTGPKRRMRAEDMFADSDDE